MVSLWIDTDVGTNVDDAVALLVAVAHPAVDLTGISIVGDDQDRRAGVARRLVPRGVPVVAGAAPPDPASAGSAVPPAPQDAGERRPRGHQDVGERRPAPGEGAASGAAGAVAAAAVAAAVARARPDVLLAIGPLTNVAALAAAGGPELPPLVVMGGAARPVHHRGAFRRVEYNFGADPRAADRVLRSLPGVTIVPLDATVATCLDDAGRAALAAAGPPGVLAPMIDDWLAGAPAVCLHDAAALLVAAGDAVIAHEARRRVAVEADGRLVGDPRHGVEHRLITGLDGPAVTRRVLDLLDGGG